MKKELFESIWDDFRTPEQKKLDAEYRDAQEKAYQKWRKLNPEKAALMGKYFNDIWNHSEPPASDEEYFDQFEDKYNDIIKQQNIKAAAEKRAARYGRWADKYNNAYGATPEKLEARKKAKNAEAKLTRINNQIADLEDQIKRLEDQRVEVLKWIDEDWAAAGGKDFWNDYKIPKKIPEDFE